MSVGYMASTPLFTRAQTNQHEWFSFGMKIAIKQPTTILKPCTQTHTHMLHVYTLYVEMYSRQFKQRSKDGH